MKRTSSWIFYFIIEREKLVFCNADADVNANADADISKWFCKTTPTTKIQVQEIESEQYS